MAALCCALAACGGGGAARTPATTASPEQQLPAAPNPGDAAFDALIPSSTRSIVHWQAETFVVLTYIEQMGASSSECWKALKDKIVNHYQIQLWESRSFFLLEGDLSMDEVESCVRTALTLLKPPKVQHEGELYSMTWPDLGEVIGAQRGRYLIFGSRPEILEALSGPRAAPGWAARMASYPPDAMVVAANDYLFENLLQVTNSAWSVVFENFPTAPSPAIRESFRGYVAAHYASPEDAARAVARLKQGNLGFPLELPPSVAAALSKMRLAQEGRDLKLHFDFSILAGIDLAEIQAWVEKHQAQAAPAAK